MKGYVAAGVSCVIAALASGGASAQGTPNVLTINIEQETTWVRNFNPFNATSARQSTRDFIYEPLVVFAKFQNGKPYPRLAKSFELAGDLKSVVFELREGLKWSDGKPLTADDVKFTFDLLKKTPALDFISIWKVIDSVEVQSPTKVRFTFPTQSALAPEKIVEIPIVPQHIWSGIADPVTYLNEQPVGSGPVTEVTRFTPQVYEQCRNPNYWDSATLKVDCIRFPQLANNDQVLAAARSGDLDWFGSFLPDIEKTYVADDPKNRKYWFPAGSLVAFNLNQDSPNEAARKAFRDINFRRAVSMAFDRRAMIDIAAYGYPTINEYASALGARFDDWVNKDAEAKFGVYTRHDLAAAKALLDKSGYADKDGDGKREAPDGSKLAFDLIVPSGWTDWINTVQIAIEGLNEAGLSVTMGTPEGTVWRQKLTEGSFDMAINSYFVGATPYYHYDDALHSRNKGVTRFVAHRFFDPEFDRLLDSYAKTADEAARRKAIRDLQMVVAEKMPLIPVFNNPVWFEYSTKRFTGFASKDNPFVSPQTHNLNHDRLLHLLALRPVAQ